MRNGTAGSVALLIKHGANVNARMAGFSDGGVGDTVLEYYLRSRSSREGHDTREDKAEILEILKKHGATARFYS